MQTLINQDVAMAKDFLKAGEVVAIPTETVYGLAANAFDDNAIDKIFKIKNRPNHNPLIAHIGNFEQLELIANPLPSKLNEIIKELWPGPITILCEKRALISSKVTAGSNFVAVRMPKHTLTLELLNQLDFPIVAPSANISNRISPTEANHVCKYFDTKIPMILDGGSCSMGMESTIISYEKNQIVIHRKGAISKKFLESFGNDVVFKNNEKISTPGNFSKHYAPMVPMYLTDDPVTLSEIFVNKKVGFLLYNNHEKLSKKSNIYYLSDKKSDLKLAMKNLYLLMHKLEQDAIEIIIAEMLPDHDEGSTINDRLKRASKSQYIFKNNNLNLHEFTTFNR